MIQKKISSLFVVAFLALAGIGITYAGWTDTITVTGNVQNGDVDMNVIEYSGTWVYKIDPHGILRQHGMYGPTEPTDGWGSDPLGTPANAIGGYNDNDWVARAWAQPTIDDNDGLVDDSVTITFENLFPCQDFTADFIVKYEGSIPARLARSLYIETDAVDGPLWVDGGLAGGSDWMDDLWLYHAQNPDYGIWIETYDITEVTDPAQYVNPDNLVEFGYQVHEGDLLYFMVTIHIPQNNIYQGCSGNFDFQLFALQWDVFDNEIGDIIDP